MTGRQRKRVEKASLGVGHVWYDTRCPAYASLKPKDCTCAKRYKRSAEQVR